MMAKTLLAITKVASNITSLILNAECIQPIIH